MTASGVDALLYVRCYSQAHVTRTGWLDSVADVGGRRRAVQRGRRCIPSRCDAVKGTLKLDLNS